ncbi:hypothetical protein [Larkinella soli]|uniref:hypothetical protein n=1 Tax=Larkinella soli TaxID=1770527 RepID=UPI000FFC4AD0|nr:hypothetical protein [Larkinella soli]
MKTWSIVILMVGITAGVGQAGAPPYLKWNSGLISLTDGRQLEGEVNYNWKAEVVLYHCPDGRVQSFTADQVSQFRFFDENRGGHRRFLALSGPGVAGTGRKLFMEEVVSGAMPVYRRLRHQWYLFKLNTLNQYGDDTSLSRNTDNFRYYVMLNNTFTDLNDFERAIWPWMVKEFKTDLKRYRATTESRMSGTFARLQVIMRYNFLEQRGDRTAFLGPQAH